PFGGGGDAWAGVCRPPGRVSRACGPFAQTTGAQQLNTGTGVAIPSRCWDQAEASYQGKRPPWSQVLGPVPGRAGMVPRGLVPDVLPGQGRVGGLPGEPGPGITAVTPKGIRQRATACVNTKAAFRWPHSRLVCPGTCSRPPRDLPKHRRQVTGPATGYNRNGSTAAWHCTAGTCTPAHR